MRFLEGKKRVHFVGIGGVGMSALAKTLLYWGYSVTGSDLKENKWVHSLRSGGAKISLGHNGATVRNADLVVYSSAICRDNPELSEAKRRGIPACHRAELLSDLVSTGVLVAVSGTHGKTTTTSMISQLLSTQGYNPTCFVGGRMVNAEDNVIRGCRELFVAEIDESDRSQSNFHPDYLVLTNIEAEHLDVYSDLNDIKRAFSSYVGSAKACGKVIFSAECPNVCEIMKNFPGHVSFGLSPKADYYAGDISLSSRGAKFSVYHDSKFLGLMELRLLGLHNVLNSLATVAFAGVFGINFEAAREALYQFRGVGRRLEIKLDSDDLMVIDDYAHHPTEIKAGLEALGLLARPVTVVFQPHRFSRTLRLAREFGPAFRKAGRVILTDIYSAGEKPEAGVSSDLIYKVVKEDGHPDVCFVGRSGIIDYLKHNARRGEIIAFVGAGDISELANEYVSQYQSFAQV
ncbi:MAG: UDP-N-acetylmuramate--L-alanine ligase [Candidatus Omnitrophica bacterium]|nr:UDP-N-acetylmuramate--L-alanine ligase [Candidatus Omnitrophota bacterium]